MNTIKPLDTILHRELYIHDAKEHLQPQLELLESITNYGTSLIAGTFHTSDKKMSDVVVLLVLLKQVVSMLDAIHVLATNACTQASLLQMRALFEASVYIDWIIHSDSEKKAKLFYVSNLRKELIWLYRTQEGNQEHDRFFDQLGEFGEAMEETRDRLSAGSEKYIESIEKLLSHPELLEANEKLDKAKGNKKYEPAWYTPFGMRSIRQIANDMNRLHEYEIFYSQASEKMHGSDYRSHVRFSGGTVNVEPIRNLDGLTTIINYVVSATLHTYKVIINRYRPAQIKEFGEKYLQYWRKPFLNMPDINYKRSGSKPTL